MLLGVLSVLWSLGMLFGPLADALFALTPGLTLSNYYLWTFVTAGLYENSFFMGLVNICVYVAVAPMLERSWGGYSFVKFIAVVNLAVAVTVWLCMVACYAATEFEPCLCVHTASTQAMHWRCNGRGVLPSAFPFFSQQQTPSVDDANWRDF